MNAKKILKRSVRKNKNMDIHAHTHTVMSCFIILLIEEMIWMMIPVINNEYNKL